VSEQDQESAAGCGLAAYAMLLLGICLIGVAGIVLSSINLLSMEPDAISRLVHGSEVPVWRLQPMRDAGLLELKEVPLAWHDESPARDGTSICALRQKSVVHLQASQGQELVFSKIESITTKADGQGAVLVAVNGASMSLSCQFGAGEGAESFVRQIEKERSKAAAQSD
jgi:hypothetical protein